MDIEERVRLADEAYDTMVILSLVELHSLTSSQKKCVICAELEVSYRLAGNSDIDATCSLIADLFVWSLPMTSQWVTCVPHQRSPEHLGTKSPQGHEVGYGWYSLLLALCCCR